MLKSVLLLLAVLILLAHVAVAAEVKNLAMRQIGNSAVVDYDLSGRPGERETDVTVWLVIGGERYGADQLKLAGDFGGKVKIGPGKRIAWDVISFMPSGFEGEIAWEITVNNSGFKDPNTGMQIVSVKGACYQMGDTFGDGLNDEKPAHEVCIDDFAIAKHDVTVGIFRKFVASTRYRTDAENSEGCTVWNGRNFALDVAKNWRNPGFDQDDSHPVVCVSWNDAVAFIDWFKESSGREYRLPTEAEWEYAARSGGKKERYAGTSNAKKLHNFANFCDANCEFDWKIASQNDGYKYTAPVGTHKPNGLGLYDMSGNVWQWLQDRYDADYYRQSKKTNPAGPTIGSLRVVRGASWTYQPVYARAAGRGKLNPDAADSSVGFRVASSPVEAKVTGRIAVIPVTPANKAHNEI